MADSYDTGLPKPKLRNQDRQQSFPIGYLLILRHSVAKCIFVDLNHLWLCASEHLGTRYELFSVKRARSEKN